MKSKHVLVGCLVALLVVNYAATLLAQGSEKESNLKFYGDLRLRFEKDYDVSGKDDRDRTRYRFRFGLTHTRGKHIEVGARLATGKQTDQQSPHQTLGDDFGKKDFHMDKAYFKYKFKSGWFWLGKNSFPFWKQNEIFWDDDVNPEGGSVSYSAKDFAGPGSKLTLTGAQYIIDDFNDLFDTSISAAQAAFHKKTDTVGFTVAAGYYYFNNNSADTLAFNALNDMNSGILVASGQVKFNLTPTLPVTIGADYMNNFEDPTLSGFENETTGFVVQAAIGKLKKRGDWLAAFYYLHIEKFAVVANFAQDDWWRFGSGHTDSSNLEGFELRVAYQLGPKMNLVARHYVTEEIVAVRQALSKREANRFRLDFNIKY